MSNLDNYYQACEDAIRCQAKKNTLGVTSHLAQAAQLRDDLVQQYRSRLELGSIRGVQDYWECTLLSLPYAERTGKAAIYLPGPFKKPEVVDLTLGSVYRIDGRPL